MCERERGAHEAENVDEPAYGGVQARGQPGRSCE